MVYFDIYVQWKKHTILASKQQLYLTTIPIGSSCRYNVFFSRWRYWLFVLCEEGFRQ